MPSLIFRTLLCLIFVVACRHEVGFAQQSERAAASDHNPEGTQAMSVERLPGRPAAEDARRISYELRWQLLTPSYRFSQVDGDSRYRGADTSIYFSPGLGFRVVSKEGHAFLLDGEYRFDVDLDGIFEEASFPIRFAVGHAGYGYRYAFRGRLGRVWTITPHASIAAGVAERRARYPNEDIPSLAPVVGFRAGADLDLHFNRFFIGWSLTYEYLHHTRGILNPSHFIGWNIIPVLQMGVNFGRPAL